MVVVSCLNSGLNCSKTLKPLKLISTLAFQPDDQSGTVYLSNPEQRESFLKLKIQDVQKSSSVDDQLDILAFYINFEVDKPGWLYYTHRNAKFLKYFAHDNNYPDSTDDEITLGKVDLRKIKESSEIYQKAQDGSLTINELMDYVKNNYDDETMFFSDFPLPLWNFDGKQVIAVLNEFSNLYYSNQELLQKLNFSPFEIDTANYIKFIDWGNKVTDKNKNKKWAMYQQKIIPELVETAVIYGLMVSPLGFPPEEDDEDDQKRMTKEYTFKRSLYYSYVDAYKNLTYGKYLDEMEVNNNKNKPEVNAEQLVAEINNLFSTNKQNILMKIGLKLYQNTSLIYPMVVEQINTDLWESRNLPKIYNFLLAHVLDISGDYDYGAPKIGFKKCMKQLEEHAKTIKFEEFGMTAERYAELFEGINETIQNLIVGILNGNTMQIITILDQVPNFEDFMNDYIKKTIGQTWFRLALARNSYTITPQHMKLVNSYFQNGSLYEPFLYGIDEENAANFLTDQEFDEEPVVPPYIELPIYSIEDVDRRRLMLV